MAGFDNNVGGGGGGTIPDNSILEPKYGDNSVSTRALELQAVDGSIIKNSVELTGNPIVATQPISDTTEKIANTTYVLRSRPVAINLVTYTTVGQPVGTLLITVVKVGGLGDRSSASEYIQSGDIVTYFAPSLKVEWTACVVAPIGANGIRIPTNGGVTRGYITIGFTGGNQLGNGLVTPVK